MADYKPLSNICEFLNALHIYADEARHGVTRFVEANHFCSHVRKDLRQCLIYDSNKKDARLIGVEYMIPKHIYETLDPEEQTLWHSHEFEVKSGMLVLPKPSDVSAEEWEKAEVEAMNEVIGLYGKTWHFWQVDKNDELPLGTFFVPSHTKNRVSSVSNVVQGYPTLMGSITSGAQIDLGNALEHRNERFGVDHDAKARRREHIGSPGIHPSMYPSINEVVQAFACDPPQKAELIVLQRQIPGGRDEKH